MPNNVNDDLVNHKIPFKEVLLISESGEQLGVKSIDEALKIAKGKELDLLCVAPNAKVPVCKILNYGKHRFEQQKKIKESKKKQHVTEVKPIRLSPVIDKHDLETKLRHTRKWLADGMKVKVEMRFKGRLITRVEIGKKVLEDFVSQLADIATIEKEPVIEGKTMTAIISPSRK